MLFSSFHSSALVISENQSEEKKVQQVVQQIKESSPFAPTSDYEQLSFSKSCYFGIDIKNGTMLYVRIYPNNVMDVIGLDIHNFTRTVAEDGKLEIHTTYVSLPMIPLEISGISARTLANTMHTMAARGYEYKERFPQMIRYRVKEWEKVAGVPVAEVFWGSYQLLDDNPSAGFLWTGFFFSGRMPVCRLSQDAAWSLYVFPTNS